MGGNKLTNVGTPSAGTDAANKTYVDNLAAGLDWKASVRVATTANGALSTAYENGDTVDGVTLATGDRILLKNQSTGSENGIYTVNASGSPTRATDADSNSEVSGGMAVFVEEGTTNADSGWVLTNNGSVTLGTTALTFTQFNGVSLTAGAGLTQTGNTLDVVGTADRITVNANDVDIASTYAGQTSITTLGTVATGTWNASTVGVSKGGTGVTSTTAYGVLLGGTSSTGAFQNAGAGTSGQVLTSNGASASPTWQSPAAAPSFATRETPSGSVNGSNTSFTLANTPTAGSEHVYLNGILQEPGAGNDYTISGGTITYLTAPVTGDKIRVSYRY